MLIICINYLSAGRHLIKQWLFVAIYCTSFGIAVAGGEITNYDEKVLHAEKLLGHAFETYPDGMAWAKEAKRNEIPDSTINAVYQYFQQTCRGMKGVLISLGGEYTRNSGTLADNTAYDKFGPGPNGAYRTRSGLRSYLTNRGAPAEKAQLAADGILFANGAGRAIGTKNILNKLIPLFKERGAMKSVSLDIDLMPFVCYGNNGEVESRVLFAAGNVFDKNSFGAQLFGATSKLFYLPEKFFSEFNQAAFNYYWSDEFLTTTGKAGEAYFQSLASQPKRIIRYVSTQGNGAVRHIEITFKRNNSEVEKDDLEMEIALANTTNGPIVINKRVISTIRVNRSDFLVVYKTINAKLSVFASGDGCSEIDNEILVNPGGVCRVRVSRFEVPGVRFPLLQDDQVSIFISGVSIPLSPVYSTPDPRL